MILHRYYDQVLTVTIDAPDAEVIRQKAKELLDKRAKNLVIVEMAVGIAKRHPSDKFNRSIGRSLSIERLEKVTFKVERVTIDSSKYSSLISLVLVSEDDSLGFILTAHSNDRTHVRFDLITK